MKEKIGGIIDKINEYKKVICPTCFNWNFKVNSFSLNGDNILSNNTIEKRKWKELFKDGKLIITGQLETVKYSQWGWDYARGSFKRERIDDAVERDITIEEKEEIKGWKDKEEPKTNGEERKEFILEEAHCKDCGKKLVLKDFNIKELRGV
ncbi:MAG: hypothetical protein MRERV_87c001 [Mycoplasmataceae bacterium RV_VA103A]|nr:MAG: hypothetical protein MRERV_87c001 [Mycoplasmataceae bacterium RV_VA103A]